jgi:very-short-patch-repair endonuclease
MLVSMRPEIKRARQFRRHMSEPEIMLWARLKGLRERGFHFRRQAPIRGYFLDFVCFPRRLVVEVDGGQHAEDDQAEHDQVRDRILQRQGFMVLRFWASDVRRNIGWVMDRIVEALDAAPLAHGRQALNAELEPHSPTLAASRPVPPH